MRQPSPLPGKEEVTSGSRSLATVSFIMLRRKTIIVLVITLMVTAMVSAFSYLYISQILRLRIANANETATSLTHQLAYAAANAVPDFGST